LVAESQVREKKFFGFFKGCAVEPLFKRLELVNEGFAHFGIGL
jgi:hypothetical protein